MTERLSIVIPTYNEADNIQRLVRYLLESNPSLEVIVSDGGSADGTQQLARAAGAKVIESPKKGRASQMNAGAAEAVGSILYFLHADTLPPPGFQDAILESCTSESGAGCFRLQFDDDHWFLRANAWLTRFDIDSIRFGDQSLFIRRGLFEQLSGFQEDLLLMEDQEIIRRIRKCTGFRILPKSVITSSRKYQENGRYRLQLVFFVIWLLYYLGIPQQQLVRIYNRLIRKSKLRN